MADELVSAVIAIAADDIKVLLNFILGSYCVKKRLKKNLYFVLNVLVAEE
jgi:hypothetical protein